MAGTSTAMTALIDSIIPQHQPYRNYGQFLHDADREAPPKGMRLGCACVLLAKRPAAIFLSIFFPRKTIRAMVCFRSLSMVRRLLIFGGQEFGKLRPPSRSRRERLTAERSRPEMAPQRLEKIESAPGNGMGSEASNLQHLVRERAADRALRRIVSDRRLRPSGHSSRIRSAGRPMGNFPPRNPLKSLKTGKESRRRLRLSGHGLRIRRARRPREKSCRKRRLTL